MKCPTCGADLQIEDEKCPFCANPNPFAVKHRQDMDYYRQEFQKTKREVELKTGRFTLVTVKITVIALLLVLLLGMMAAMDEAPYAVWTYRIEKDIRTHEQEYAIQMQTYERSGDWIGLYAFYSKKHLYYGEAFSGYYVIQNAAFQYQGILHDVMCWTESSEYFKADNAAPRIAEALDSFYQMEERTSYTGSYYDDCYTKEHQEALAHMREDLEAVLMAYCHLTEEEVAVLLEYSISKKSSLIKEGLFRGNALEGLEEAGRGAYDTE